jgi:purine-binding chemotaxis protein CheW
MTTDTLTPKSAAQAGKYLTFVLGSEHYAVPVLKVREIIRLCDITPVPRMPEHIKGVINLRGKIIPVTDLRLRFALAQAAATELTCIVVVHVAGAGNSQILIGMIVDAVDEVVNIAASDIEPTPDFGSSLDTEFIVGMAKMKGVVKTLLDIDRVLTTDSESLAPPANA